LSRRCDTCEKRESRYKCKVLTKMIGQKGKCWAWTDDAFWEAEFMRDAERYAGERCYKNHENIANVAG